jgi:hypothetical protein
MFAALLLLVAASADLDAAQKAWADVDYARCRDRAQAALLVPAERSERVATYKLLGLCAAATNDADSAREAFRMMLAIDRDARLPDGLSPRFTSSFREAKGSWVGMVPVALGIKKESVTTSARTVIVRVTDEADLVASIRWQAEGGTQSAPVKASSTVELLLPTGPAITVVGLDAHGGEVAVLELPAVKAATGPNALDEPPPPAAATVDDGGVVWPFVIGGVVGGALVVGGAAALVVVLLSPPSAVTLATDVTFADR